MNILFIERHAYLTAIGDWTHEDSLSKCRPVGEVIRDFGVNYLISSMGALRFALLSEEIHKKLIDDEVKFLLLGASL